MTTLPSQAWSHAARIVLFPAVLLFVCAWTPSYWQAWVYLGIQGLAACFNTAYFLRRDPALLQRRLRAGPAAETTPAQRRIQTVAGLCIAGIFVLTGLDHRWHGSSVPVAIVMAGDGLLVVGLLLVFA